MQPRRCPGGAPFDATARAERPKAARPRTAMTPLRVIFAGTPEFAVPSLSALIEAQASSLARPPLELVAVYTQPDRPAGRGRRLQASPVKRLAVARGLTVVQPESFRKDPQAVADLAAFDADLMVVVAYGLILPPDVLEAPRLGCVNVHASLLPRWRGAAPIQRALLAGDRETGVCIMRMEAGLDTGPVYHRLRTPIGVGESAALLHERLARLGAQALIEALPGIADGSLTPQPQTDAQVTYAHKLTKEEAEIDWRQPAEVIARQVRALDPWPVAQTRLGGETLRVWRAEADPDRPVKRPPGTVLSATPEGIDVATGRGVLRLIRLQPPGRRAMSAADYLNARAIDGALLG